MATESGFSACRAPIGHLAASAAAARSESVRQRIAARRRRRARNFRRARECGVSSAVRVRAPLRQSAFFGSDSSVDRLSSTAKPNHHSDIMQVARVGRDRERGGGGEGADARGLRAGVLSTPLLRWHTPHAHVASGLTVR